MPYNRLNRERFDLVDFLCVSIAHITFTQKVCDECKKKNHSIWHDVWISFLSCVLFWHIWNMIWVDTVAALKRCLGQFEWHFKGLKLPFWNGRKDINELLFSINFHATSDERIKFRYWSIWSIPLNHRQMYMH